MPDLGGPSSELLGVGRTDARLAMCPRRSRYRMATPGSGSAGWGQVTGQKARNTNGASIHTDIVRELIYGLRLIRGRGI